MINSLSFRQKSNINSCNQVEKPPQKPSLRALEPPRQDAVFFGANITRLPDLKDYPPFIREESVDYVKPITISKLNGGTLQPTEAFLVKSVLPCGDLSVYSKGGSRIGVARFTKNPIYPQYLYLESLRTNEGYKGVGTALIQGAVEESEKLGKNGQIITCAHNVYEPKRGCPVPFYAKLGFISKNFPWIPREKLIQKYSQPKRKDSKLTMVLLLPENQKKLKNPLYQIPTLLKELVRKIVM